jgi:hypothetical protein
LKREDIRIRLPLDKDAERSQLAEYLREVHGVFISSWKVRAMTLPEMQKVVEVFKEQM